MVTEYNIDNRCTVTEYITDTWSLMCGNRMHHWHLMYGNWIHHWHLTHSNWIHHWHLTHCNWIHHWHLTHVNWIRHWHLMAEAWMRTAHNVKRWMSQTHSTVGMLSAHAKYCNSWLTAERPLKRKVIFYHATLAKDKLFTVFSRLTTTWCMHRVIDLQADRKIKPCKGLLKASQNKLFSHLFFQGPKKYKNK